MLAEVATFHRGLLKIDTQGYELAVIAGARETLRRCAYVQLEVAFKKSYVGQPTVAEVLSAMHDATFVVVEILDILRERNLPGSPMIEADLLFARAGVEST
jgi:hypothetical protein